MIKYFCRRRHCCRILFTLSIALALINTINNHSQLADYTTDQVSLNNNVKLVKKNDSKNLKYILLWTPKESPLDKIVLRGRDPFIKHQCKHTNCYLTHNRSYKDQTTFDAIVFSIKALNNISMGMPTERLPKQKFVASSIDLPVAFNILNPYADNFFNWTWTFKLSSDILWRHFKIYNKMGIEIGPKQNIKWLDNFQEITEEVEDVLFGKTKVVVWYVTECDFDKHLREYVRLLEKELYNKKEMNSNIDILGNCSFAQSCGNKSSCLKKIKNDYQFLIAFENDIYPDYVSENILIAMQHFAIPVVFGSQMYSSFLPPGSYLDAAELSPEKMAEEIKKIVDDYALFKGYFNWTNNYYYKSPESEICNICTALNDKQKVESVNTYKEFRKWWNGEETQYTNDIVLSLLQKNVKLQKALRSKNQSVILNMLSSMLATDILKDIDTVFFNFSTTEANALYGEDSNIIETTENFYQGNVPLK